MNPVIWCRACGSRVPFSLQGCASCGAGLLKAGEAPPAASVSAGAPELQVAEPVKRGRKGKAAGVVA